MINRRDSLKSFIAATTCALLPGSAAAVSGVVNAKVYARQGKITMVLTGMGPGKPPEWRTV
jgi:hypothetical protein